MKSKKFAASTSTYLFYPFLFKFYHKKMEPVLESRRWKLSLFELSCRSIKYQKWKFRKQVQLYTPLQNVWSGSKSVVTLLTNKLWLVFMGKKQKESKMADSKKQSFSKSPILKIFSQKFHRLVLGLVGLIDAKGIKVAQPILSWGCLI